MRQTAQDIRTLITTVRRHHHAADEAIEQLLTLARTADATDPDADAALLEAAHEIGRSGQARQGQIVKVLAEADRIKTPRGGLGPWIATHLDSTHGAARGFAQSIREIGHLPELRQPLSSGQIGAPTIRALTRAALAARKANTDIANAVTATLHTATHEGVGEAVRQVRLLEQTTAQGTKSPLEHQRRRSYLRIRAADGGMTRIATLLDPERANTVRAMLEHTTAALLHEHRTTDTPTPEHLRTLEQLQAHALTLLAQTPTPTHHTHPKTNTQPTDNPNGPVDHHPGPAHSSGEAGRRRRVDLV